MRKRILAGIALVLALVLVSCKGGETAQNISEENKDSHTPPTSDSYSKYEDFIEGIAHTAAQMQRKKKTSDILEKKAFIIPVLKKNNYVPEIYTVGENNSYIYRSFVLDDPNIKAPRVVLDGAIGFYVDYNGEKLLPLDETYNQRMSEDKKKLKGETKVFRGHYRENEYVVREYYPSTDDKINKVPTSTVDTVYLGKRVRIFICNKFSEEYFEWFTFETVNISAEIDKQVAVLDELEKSVK